MESIKDRHNLVLTPCDQRAKMELYEPNYP